MDCSKMEYFINRINGVFYKSFEIYINILLFHGINPFKACQMMKMAI